MRRRTLILGAAAAAVVAGTGGVVYGAWQAFRRAGEAEPPRIPPPLSDMTWQLTDQTGRTVRPADWIGRPTMAFFGFTWCPDVCPTTLLKIAGWLKELGAAGESVRVVLITVDPERDTPEVMGRYVVNFGPEIVALTGTPDEIAATAAAFQAVYEKVPQEDGGYTMNHTAGVFLFRDDGAFAGIVDYHESHNLAMLKVERLVRADDTPGDAPDDTPGDAPDDTPGDAPDGDGRRDDNGG